MDKQGRLTKWEEWEVGRSYAWKKGKQVLHPSDKCLEVNKKEGYILLANGAFPDGYKTWGWQRRYVPL